ncbi:MAG: nuclear transport factor 2 family protein, partial [Arachidicoccus sp.]|nr:nuclear transport factor 2 family protein [Arachidicoccus sp.]
MTIQEIAERFYELDSKGDFKIIYEELYSPDVKSIEPAHSVWATTEGIEGIYEKGKKFHETLVEFHGGYTNPPIVAGNFFALSMGIDATFKDRGRVKLDEIALYE